MNSVKDFRGKTEPPVEKEVLKVETYAQRLTQGYTTYGGIFLEKRSVEILGNGIDPKFQRPPHLPKQPSELPISALCAHLQNLTLRP